MLKTKNLITLLISFSILISLTSCVCTDKGGYYRTSAGTFLDSQYDCKVQETPLGTANLFCVEKKTGTLLTMYNLKFVERGDDYCGSR